MSFRCLFIIRIFDVDNNDLQPFCYKSFNAFNKDKISDKSDSLNVQNFSEWYQDVLRTLSDSKHTNFDESSIRDYLSNPIYKVETNWGILEPCILISKNNFIFGGLLYKCEKQSKMNFKYEFGTSLDFISGMTSYFIGILKKNPKFKMIDLMPDFYYFIKIMCPYGTPVTSNSNLVEYFKNSENILKSLSISSPEKTIFSINQIPINNPIKNKELRLTIKEVVTGVQHENKNGQAKFDIDIVGEVSLSASNLDLNGQISLTLKSSPNNMFFSRSVITDILLHPSCVSCNYQTPATISMQNRKSMTDLLDKTTEYSPDSPNFLNENSLLQSANQRYNSVDSLILNRRLQSISRSTSICSNTEPNKLSSSVSLIVKPWSDYCTLFTYKIMQQSPDSDNETISLPFVTSLRTPEPPVICSYQLEDMPVSSEAISNIILRIKLNPRILSIGEKSKNIEFTKFEVLFPFFNRHPIFDVSKCSVSQGKLIILEQNRHIMLWSIGSVLKKNEANLMGSVKFQSDSSQAPYVDKFCVQSNAYCQINFSLKNVNLSGLTVDTRTILFTMDTGVKITQKQECVSHNFKVWNSMGVCPSEFIY